jgi:hypothetical protein
MQRKAFFDSRRKIDETPPPNFGSIFLVSNWRQGLKFFSGSKFFRR